MTDEALQARVEAARRLRDWDQRTLQGRRYALLVTGYCRLRFGHLWAPPGASEHPGDRYKLLAEAERVAGRLYAGAPRLAELQALAARLQTRANRSAVVERRALALGEAIPGHILAELLGQQAEDELDAIRLLARSLHQPEAAARELIESDLTDPIDALGVMECVRPANWDAGGDWFATDLPRDAYTWARRCADAQDFSSLPILADRLEDAGCPDRVLLDHCRGDCAHVRGCAALDRLLGFQT